MPKKDKKPKDEKGKKEVRFAELANLMHDSNLAEGDPLLTGQEQPEEQGLPKLKVNSSYVPMKEAMAPAAANAAATDYETLQLKQADAAAPANANPAKIGYDKLQGPEGPNPYDHVKGFAPAPINQPPSQYDALSRDEQTALEATKFSNYQQVPGVAYEGIPEKDFYGSAHDTIRSNQRPPAGAYLPMNPDIQHQYETVPTMQGNQHTSLGAVATYMSAPHLEGGYTDIHTGGIIRNDGDYDQAFDTIPTDQRQTHAQPIREKRKARFVDQEKEENADPTTPLFPAAQRSIVVAPPPPRQDVPASVRTRRAPRTTNTTLTPSREKNLASRFNIGLTHWWYQFCRYGLAAFPVGFLMFLIIEFAKLNPQEQEFIMQDPQNSLQFFTLQVLSIYYGSLLNNRLFLFTDPYPEVHGYEFALRSLNATYCVPQRNLVTAFSESMKAQGFKETVKFIPGGVDQCFYPHENSTFPSGLWNLLGLSPADANDLNYHYTAMVFWVLIALSMAIVFANPTNVRTQTQILMGLIELAKSIVWVPFQLFGSLIQLFFMMSTFWCVNQQRRMLDWTLGQLNGFLVVFSDHLGDNATALSLSERPSSVPRSLGCGLPVSYEAQLAVLRGLRVRLDDGITLNLGTRLAMEFDALDDRINRLAQKGKLTESIVFGDLLGLDTKELIAIHRRALLTLFFPKEFTPAERDAHNPVLLAVINDQITQCKNQTLREYELQRGTANHFRVNALAKAGQHLARDVRNLFWKRRLRHEIIKHFENMNLPPLQTNISPRQTRAIRDFKVHLIECWPGLFAILMVGGYEKAMQALNIEQNENRFAWFRGASDWKAYFRVIGNQHRPQMTREQLPAVEVAASALTYLYQCTDPLALAARQFENPAYEQPALSKLADRDRQFPDSHGFINPLYDAQAVGGYREYLDVVARAPQETHLTYNAAAKHEPEYMTFPKPPKRGNSASTTWTVREMEEEEEWNASDDEDISPLLDNTESQQGTGVRLRSTARSGKLPTLGDNPSGRYSQTEGFNSTVDSSWLHDADAPEGTEEEAAAADRPSLRRRGASHSQAAEPESSRNPLRHFSMQRRPSITRQHITLAELFSQKSVISFRELMTNEDSHNLFACDLRDLQVKEAAAEYTNATFDHLHRQLLGVCDFRKKSQDTSRQLYVLMAGLSHYCQQYPDTDNQKANAASPVIRDYNEKLTRGEAASANTLAPHLQGIYYLLLSPGTPENQRNDAVTALEKIMRLQHTQQYQVSGQKAALARFYKDPAASAAAAATSPELTEEQRAALADADRVRTLYENDM